MPFDAKIRREILKRIQAAVPEVREVLLFGSRARGDAREDSDVDLVLIVPDDADRHALAVRARKGLLDVEFAFDILALTEQDWRRVRASRGWYDRELSREAVRLDEAA